MTRRRITTAAALLAAVVIAVSFGAKPTTDPDALPGKDQPANPLRGKDEPSQRQRQMWLEAKYDGELA